MITKFQLKKMNEIAELIDTYITENDEKAIEYAYDIYYQNFNKKIQEILINSPLILKMKMVHIFIVEQKKFQFLKKKEKEILINYE